MRAARINPTGLHWRRFVVAEECGRLVGVGQVKPHYDGSHELASLAVVPDRQGQGIGSAIVRTLLAHAPSPLHLMCADRLEPYYARFGFRRLRRGEMPPYFRSMYWLARVLAFIARVAGVRIQLSVMRRDA